MIIAQHGIKMALEGITKQGLHKAELFGFIFIFIFLLVFWETILELQLDTGNDVHLHSQSIPADEMDISTTKQKPAVILDEVERGGGKEHDSNEN
jgi:hypothetical protein